MAGRRKFIEELGGTCRNWQRSWSFRNDGRKEVYFGAWDDEIYDLGQLILDESWSRKKDGSKSAYCLESLMNVHLTQGEFDLFTFRMTKRKNSDGKVSIKQIFKQLERCEAMEVDGRWYALPAPFDQNKRPLTPSQNTSVNDEENENWRLLEGKRQEYLATKWERNPKARTDCLKHYGYTCFACERSLFDIYGEVAIDFIHVHHLIPGSKRTKAYQVDPVNDLRPLCPNCHAVAHRRDPPFSMEELKRFLALGAATQ